MSENFLNQSSYLCSRISEVEWSGILFYSETEGSIDNPDTLVLTLESIYPVDKGSKAYTGFDTADSDIMAFLMNNPNLLEMNQGFIHSHNSMKAFFSGTDMDELRDNCKNHNYYLSVIVNNVSDIVAKVAVYVEDEYSVQGTRVKMNSLGQAVKKSYTIPTGRRSIMEHYDCKIIRPEALVSDWFKERTDEIIKQAEAKKIPPKTGVQGDLFPNFFQPKTVTSPTPVSFVAKFIMLDLEYSEFTFDAMKELEAQIKELGEDYDIQAEYLDSFDVMFDEYFTNGIVSEIEVVNQIQKLIQNYKSSFPTAYTVMQEVCNSLLEGVEDEDEYDLTNPNNTGFHGR